MSTKKLENENSVLHGCVFLGKATSSLTGELMLPGQDAVANNHHCQNRRCIYLILSYMPRNSHRSSGIEGAYVIVLKTACLSGALLSQSKYIGEIMLID